MRISSFAFSAGIAADDAGKTYIYHNQTASKVLISVQPNDGYTMPTRAL